MSRKYSENQVIDGVLKLETERGTYTIKKEWEKNRKEWYQNNQRFNPIYKINERNNDERIRNQYISNNYDNSTTIQSSRNNNGGGGDNNINNNNNNNNNGRNDGNGRGGGNNGNRNNENQDLFSNLPRVHSNQ